MTITNMIVIITSLLKKLVLLYTYIIKAVKLDGPVRQCMLSNDLLPSLFQTHFMIYTKFT